MLQDELLFEELNNPRGGEPIGNAERPDARVNVNTATAADLQALPGLGPAKVAALLEAVAKSPIRELSELEPVLGRSTLEKIRPRLDVTDYLPGARLETKIANALGIDRAVLKTVPLLRLLTSEAPTVRRLATRLFDKGGLIIESEVAGQRAPMAIESLIKRRSRDLAQALEAVDGAYNRYRERVSGQRLRRAKQFAKATGVSEPVTTLIAGQVIDAARNLARRPTHHLTTFEFRQRWALALHFGGEDAIDVAQRAGLPWRFLDEKIPEVGEAAASVRRYADQLLADGRELGLITPEAEKLVKDTSPSWYLRHYDYQKIAAERPLWERQVAEGMMERDPELTIGEAAAYSKAMTDDLLSVPEGRLPGFSLATPTHLRMRLLPIATEKLLPWMELDGEALLRIYHRTAVPDLEVARFLRSLRSERTKAARMAHVRGDVGRLRSIELEEVQALQRLNLALKTEDKELLAKNLTAVNETREKMGEGSLSADEARQLASFPTEITAKPVDLEDLSDLRELIAEDYERLRERTKDPARRKNLSDAENRDAQHFTELIGILRGTWRHPWDRRLASRTTGRVLRFLRQLNTVTMMGQVVASSIPDVARLAAIDGIDRALGDAIVPWLRSIAKPDGSPAFTMTRQQIKDLHLANEVVTNNRMSLLSDIGEDYGHLSKVERGLEHGVDAFYLLNWMNPWNDFWKELTGVVQLRQIVRSATEFRAGKTLDQKVTTRLASIGIDEPMLKRISTQLERHGGDDMGDGVVLPNLDQWDGPAGEIAREAVRTSLIVQADNTIVTPGVALRPLMMGEGMFQTLLQFKTFMFNSTVKALLVSAQLRDAWILQSVLSAVSMGMLTYVLKSWLNDRPISFDPRTLALEGVDRSGITGILMEADALMTDMTGGGVGLGPMLGAPSPTRRTGPLGIYRSAFGPSFDRLRQVQTLLTDVTHLDPQARDSKILRQWIPGQNLPPISWALNEIGNLQGATQ